MKNFLNEFKAFVMKGNVIELAVAVVLGAAFKPVIDSVVSGLLMPIIGAVFGEPSFEAMTLKLTDDGAHIMYGLILTTIIKFVLTGFALFVIIKAYRSTQKPEEPKAPAGPSNEEKLLMEIRDSLKK